MSEDEVLPDEMEAEELVAEKPAADELDFLNDSPQAEIEAGAESDSGAESEPDGEVANGDLLGGTELEEFESAAIEDLESLEESQIRSIVESVLFATDKPLSLAVIKQSFKGTSVRNADLRQALTALEEEYASTPRGFYLIEAGGGFQLRTKGDNLKYLRQSIKARPFKLSGPALEVLSIVAYKQPVTKNQIDEIRGVESGHLLRALMEKNLLAFGERSDLPGKPMYYESTRKFLEIFSLRNLAELPSLAEIDQLIPEGIGDEDEKETLGDLTGELSQEVGSSYSEGEDELLKITDELTQISTSSDFFEQEKERQREKRDRERAQDIREAIILGNPVEAKDQRWLDRYDLQQTANQAQMSEAEFVTEGLEAAAEPSQPPGSGSDRPAFEPELDPELDP